MKKRILSYLLLFTLTNGSVIAQEYMDDAALWLNVALEKELNNKLDLNLKLQNRINNNVTEYGQGTIDLGVTYKINKLFRVSADYMWRERRRLDGSYSTRHQFYVAAYLRKRMGKFLFVYRNRIQARYKNVMSSNEGSYALWHDRHKFLIRYEINKRFDAYISEELYSPLQNMKLIGFDRSRTAVGVIYKLSKNNSIEGYFLFQKELYSDKQLRRDYVYGITYNHRF